MKQLSDREKFWGSVLFFSIVVICLTDSIVSYNMSTASLHISMDNNTLEAIKSINYTAIERSQEKKWECKNSVCGDPQVWDLERSTVRVIE